MNAKFKRGELPQLLENMRALTGIKSVKKALDFGRDIRKVKELTEEATEAIEKIKTPRLIELQNQFQEKFSAEIQEKGGVKNSDLTAQWEQGAEFIELMAAFNQSRNDLLNDEVKITFKTVFEDTDLSAVPDAKTAEMLGYFIK